MRILTPNIHTFRRNLRAAAVRFHQRFPDAPFETVHATIDTLAMFHAHQHSFPTFFNRCLTLGLDGDKTAGLFEPDTVLIEDWIDDDTGKLDLAVRVVTQREWDEGFYLTSELVGWSLDMLWVDMRDWCRDDRGIKIVRHKLSKRDTEKNVYELVFQAPGSRTEFMMRWNTPKAA